MPWGLTMGICGSEAKEQSLNEPNVESHGLLKIEIEWEVTYFFPAAGHWGSFSQAIL